MSKIIASAGIRGAHTVVNRAEEDIKRAIDKYGPNQEVGFPNTAYYLPIIFGMLGDKIEKLSDMELLTAAERRRLENLRGETDTPPAGSLDLEAGFDF